MNSMGQQESSLSAPCQIVWSNRQNCVSRGRGFRPKSYSRPNYPAGGTLWVTLDRPITMAQKRNVNEITVVMKLKAEIKQGCWKQMVLCKSNASLIPQVRKWSEIITVDGRRY